MSISARATHVMSTMLVVVFACSGSAWASIVRTAHCQMQMADCHSQAASLSCCGPSAPIPNDRAQLPQSAPAPVHGVSPALMDRSIVHTPAPGAVHSDRSSRRVRVVDLQLLHRSLVI
jgi:hypothetical protein